LEEEIDLRQYIQILLRQWKWIIGASVGAAVLALIISLLLPPTYEATALVAITKPRYIINFDAQFQTVSNIQPSYKVYPELAASDAVLSTLWQTVAPQLPDLETVQSLRGRATAEAGTDPSLVRLVVKAPTPAEAAHIANTWAEIFIRQANLIYGRGPEQLAFFETQLQQSKTELEAAEAALIAFQGQNQIEILKNRLDSARKMQADYLQEQRSIAYIIQDVQSLRAQLSGQASGYTTTLADQMTALFLQIRAFDAQASAPLQLQITSPEVLSGKSTAEQIAFLDDLVKVLEARSTESEQRLATVEPQILTLQQQVQQATIELDRLTRARDVVKETYLTLARKVEEARITAEESGDVLLASEAIPPEVPVSPRKLLNTAAAGALGFMVSVAAVLAVVWWQDNHTAREVSPSA